MYSREVTVVNPTGLHARPAAEFCKLASNYACDIKLKRLNKDMKEGNAKSLINVMAMGLAKGTPVEIIGEGADEEAAVNALADLVESGFGEK
jgi:phosphocarrier protein HPr